MTSAEQGENGVFWEQMKNLGSTKGGGIAPNASNIFLILNLAK
jgi:hypothetical protein